MQAFETDLSGKRQALADKIANIEATSCPYTSMAAKRTKPLNQPQTWQAEVYPDADHEPVEDGKDVETFDSVPRYPLMCPILRTKPTLPARPAAAKWPGRRPSH
jgi:hypothetical protein